MPTKQKEPSKPDLGTLTKKRLELKALADDLYDEILKVELGMRQRKEELDKQEDQKKLPCGMASENENLMPSTLELKLQKKEEYLRNWEKQLKLEQSMLVIGRQRIHQDIKRLQSVMMRCEEEVKRQEMQERGKQEILREVIREIEDFKPSAAKGLHI